MLHKRPRAAPCAGHSRPAVRRRVVGALEGQRHQQRLVALASTPKNSNNADRVLDATSPTTNLVDRYSGLLREFRRAKAELGGAAWLAGWRAAHGGARPTLSDARHADAPAALRAYVETRERLLAETPVLREEIGGSTVGFLRSSLRGGSGGGGGGSSDHSSLHEGAAPAGAAATAARSARAQAALTMSVAADYRKRRASKQAAVAKLERVVNAEGDGGDSAAAATAATTAPSSSSPSSSRVRAAALAALNYKRAGSSTQSYATDNEMPKPSAAVSVLSSLLKESPPKPMPVEEEEEGRPASAASSVVAVVEAAKGDVAAAMAATPRGRDKRRVGAAEGAGLAQVVL